MIRAFVIINNVKKQDHLPNLHILFIKQSSMFLLKMKKIYVYFLTG